MDLIDFFVDPILRASTWGCILMAISTSLMGVVAFLKKRSLAGETISHATYPGIVLGVLFFAIFFPKYEHLSLVSVLFFAYFFAILAMKTLAYLEDRFNVKSDASLCFVLASFFGFGILFASHAQFAFTNHFKKIQIYLYGQTATMIDFHIAIYAVLTVFIIAVLYFFYCPLQLVLFDPTHAKTLGIKSNKIDKLFNYLLVLALVIGIRSVGVILASGMLIAPVVAARQYTNRLSILFILSAILGAVSAFFGNYLSVQISLATGKTLPSGPLITLIGAMIAFLSLLIAPPNGFIFRLIRIFRFKKKCLQENILKHIWKSKDKKATYKELRSFFYLNSFVLKLSLLQMKKSKLIKKRSGVYFLTEYGTKDASNIVRLHRLWELYLADHLGMNIEKVHPNAEQMEHILTPEIEKRLTNILNNPKKDPHHQPIP